jgi:hypothetical protein
MMSLKTRIHFFLEKWLAVYVICLDGWMYTKDGVGLLLKKLRK